MRHENLFSSNMWTKVKLPPLNIWKADVSSVSPSSERMTKGNARKVSFPNRLRWSIRPLSTRLIKPNFYEETTSLSLPA